MLHTPRALPALAACGPSGVPSRIGLHPVSPVTSACPRRSPGPAAVLAPAPRVVTGLQDSAGAAPAAVTEPPTPQGSAPPAVSGQGQADTASPPPSSAQRGVCCRGKPSRHTSPWGRARPRRLSRPASRPSAAPPPLAWSRTCRHAGPAPRAPQAFGGAASQGSS